MIDVSKILNAFEDMFPNAKGELDHRNNFELLVAVVLSAQTTDVGVNKVTPTLFSYYPTPYDLANANINHVEELLNSIGLYRTKAKNIIKLSKILVDKHQGNIPSERMLLEELPGVGRKTANVVLSIAFDIPAIAVDTHVSRVSKRLGIANFDDDVLTVEKKLMQAFPKDTWQKVHHQMIFFGRYHCLARKPKCLGCPLVDICVFKDKNLDY